MSNYNSDIRKDFVMLRPDSSGRELVYLDSAASSLTPDSVVAAMDEYYNFYRANVHRGLYTASERATVAYESARHDVAGFIGAKEDEIIFTSGTTAGLNMLAQMLESDISPGDEVVVTAMEHHANLIPWQQAVLRRGGVLRVVPVTKDVRLDMTAFADMINKRTKIVAVVWASNVLGTVNPLEKMVRVVREKSSAVFVVDAAQMMLHAKVDVKKLDVDALVFSGHKMFGPTGIGVVYGKSALLQRLEPVVFGGEMIREVSFERSTWAESPKKFEAGTPNIAGAIGLGAAVRYINRLDLEETSFHEKALIAYALEKVSAIPGVTIIGPGDVRDRLGVISFVVDGIHPHDLATVLDTYGVAVRAGFHCAMPLMKELSCDTGTTRLSIAPYTIESDIDRLVEGVVAAQRVLLRNGKAI